MEVILTNYIADCLVYGTNDFPEYILESYNINYEGWSEEKITEESNKILDKYIILDDKENYIDLENSYQERTLYFEYKDQMYGIEYIESPYREINIYGKPYKVKQITETIIVNKYIPCD